MDRLPHPDKRTQSDATGHVRRAQPVIGRRSLMTLAAGAGVVAIGTAGRGVFLPWFDISRAAAAEELVAPEVRASQGGLLDTTLTARVMALPLAGQTATVSVYEGTFPGPTLRVRPGDTLRVNLVNTLDALPPALPQNSPFQCSPVTGPGQMPNSPEHAMTCDTNLHVHGLHVSPEGNSDNIFLTVKAGESFQYEYQIPENHPGGLYWYHPHRHGTVTNQVFGGMAGPIIIEGDIDALPGIAGVPERLLVLQATQLAPDGTVLNLVDVPPTGPSMQKMYLR